MTSFLSVSLNEVEATAKKAARGAGLTWGMAEEASKATRWLCASGLNGCAELSRLLTIAEHNIERSPVKEAGMWMSVSGSLCPINLGACIADEAHGLGTEGWLLNDVACPAFLLPFAADIAAKTTRSVEMSGQDFSALVDGFHLFLKGEVPVQGVSLKIRTTHKTVPPWDAISRAAPTETDWNMLQKLAHRTYAPATEASRLKGAGAGTTDND